MKLGILSGYSGRKINILIVVLLEAVRRTLGMIVPIIILIFTVYAVFGQYMPLQILMHPGISWAQYINNMYFPAEGIFGVTLWIVSTVVFHFVLFGVLAHPLNVKRDVLSGGHVSAVAAGFQVGAQIAETLGGRDPQLLDHGGAETLGQGCHACILLGQLLHTP